MEEFEELLKENKKEFLNFIAVYLAIISTIEGLQEYVQHILEMVRRDVYAKTASLPNCFNNCSRKHGRKLADWCPTCAAWKQELKKYTRSKLQISWEIIDSKDWPYSIQEISKCFLKNPTTIGQTVSGFGVLKDLSNLMSLFRNLTTCDIDIQTTINCVSNIRNKHFGHNFSARVFEPDKIYCIDALSGLLSHPSVKCFESSKSSLEFLSNLKLSNKALETIFGSNFEVPPTSIDRKSTPKDNELSNKCTVDVEEILTKIYEKNRMKIEEENDRTKWDFIRNIKLKRLFKMVCIHSVAFLLIILAMNGLPLTTDEKNLEGKTDILSFDYFYEIIHASNSWFLFHMI